MADATGPGPQPLMRPDGTPLTGPDGALAPHAYNFVQVLNTYNRLYSYRWDEALRDAPQNALAMRRDAFYQSLLQERTAANVNRKWRLVVPNPKDPLQELVRAGLQRLIEDVPDWPGFVTNLYEAVWYGRYGSQIVPAKLPGAGGWGIARHSPVNGDKIQYQWDGTPVVLVGQYTARPIRDADPQAIITTDRFGYGLRLYKPEWRERFVIHHHVAEDADFFEGEMAGGVYGVGLRSKAYWSEFMRAEALSWMMRPMEAAGTMDIYLVNYYTGNKESYDRAVENVKQISGKVAFVVPRPANWDGPPVETVPFNPAGIELLTRLVQEYYERHIERLFVGQSMSAGGGSAGGIEGDGRADFARDTKHEVVKTDAMRLSGTLTRDLVGPLLRWNFPWADFPVRFEFLVDDPEAPAKMEAGVALRGAGVPIKDDELRELAGFTEPQEGDLVNGVPYVPGQQPVSADDPPDPNDPGGGEDDPAEEDLYDLAVSADTYLADAAGHEHRDRGPGGGQFTGPGKRGPVGKAVRKAGAAGRLAKRKVTVASDAVTAKLNQTAGGRAVLAIGGPAVRVFKAIEHAALIGLHKSEELAKEALHERGGSDQDVKRLGRILFVADMIGGYASGAAGAAVGGALGAKVGSLMPTASVAYLAYSTAKNPLATWRAAKTVVRRTLGKAEPAKYEGVSADARTALADRLAAVPDPDWYEALLLAAMGSGHDLPSALTVADDALRLGPDVPDAPDSYADHKYSCVMAPLYGEARDRLIALGAMVADEDLADDGREGDPHVTVRFGLHTGDRGDVARIVEGTGDLFMRLGAVTLFEAEGRDYDVLKVDVESPDLHRMHWRLGALPHTDTHPEYHPHATIAYVKAGKGRAYMDRMAVLDVSAAASEVVFSDQDGQKSTISLIRPAALSVSADAGR